MLTAEQLAEAQQMLEAAKNGNGGGWAAAPAPVSAFAQPAQPNAGGPEAVLVPIKLQTPNGGEMRVYLQFPGAMAANPSALMNALGQLAASGMPLDVWFKKNNWGGRGNGHGGGWNGGNRGW